VTVPLFIPPVAAVYVNTIVLPVDPAVTLLVGVVMVPLPSGALTLMTGDEAIEVSAPPLVDFSWVVQVAGPPEVAAVAPGPANALLP
jgi:hypothetical protein